MAPTLSLAILARDEQDTLERTIRSARSWVDEVVVRDTGSRDATIDIALGLGARVVRGSWKHDFAEARNLLLDAVTADWALLLDADEVLAGGGEQLAGLIARPGTDAWTLEIDSAVGFGRTERGREARLLRTGARFRYQHRVHERLGGDGTVGHSGLHIGHEGWMPSRRAAKCRRNLALIDRELQDAPGHPYLLWQRFRDLELLGRPEEAWSALSAMAERLRATDGMQLSRFGWAPEAAADWIERLEDCGSAARGLGLATRIALAHPDRPLARYIHARALAAAGRAGDAACAAASLLRPGNSWRCAAAEEPEILSEHAPALVLHLGGCTAAGSLSGR